MTHNTPFNYTRINDPVPAAQAHRKIEDDIRRITAETVRLLGKNLHSLLLCGSFGRGEGGVVFEGHKIRIVNDYDFTVVLNAANPLSYAAMYKACHKPLERLGERLAKALGIKQVDLSPKPLFYFRGMPGRRPALRIENYEVKQGHVQVWPEDPAANPTRCMPDWKPEDIPLFEGTWLFRNRGTGLVLAALYFDEDFKVARENRENFIIECNKAVLAAGDSLLLLKGKYHHLYSRRLEIILQMDVTAVPGGERLRQAYMWALSFKLMPDFETTAFEDLHCLWQETLSLFESVFRWFEQYRLNRSFDTWDEYAALARPENRPGLKAFGARLIRGKKFSLSGIREAIARSAPGYTVSLTTLVAFSVPGFLKADNRNAEELMHNAAQMLGIALTGDRKEDWKRLACSLIREVHPGGEAGRVIEKIECSGTPPFNKNIEHKYQGENS